MQRIYVAITALALAGAFAPPARAADVHIGVTIVPPSFVLEAPPRLVIVPGVPQVHYAPDVSVNFFAYGGRYYTHDHGNWFVASENRGPWTYVERDHVPHHVLAVPARYYRVQPRNIGGGHSRGKGHYGHGKNHWQHKGGKDHRHGH